jgi:hypothetical protein
MPEKNLPTQLSNGIIANLHHISSQNSQMVYRYSMLTPNENFQYGYYGFGSFDFLTENTHSAIPTAWDIPSLDHQKLYLHHIITKSI